MGRCTLNNPKVLVNRITGKVGQYELYQGSGKRLPEDVSIIGLDDINIVGFSWPGLTTVRQPLRKMGRIAAKTCSTGSKGGPSTLPKSWSSRMW